MPQNYNILQSQVDRARTQPYNIIPVAQTIRELSLRYQLANRPPVVKDDNPYDNKIPQGPANEQPLYLSPLGTPVVADITFVGGSYTDENGRTVTFPTLTLATVLITVSQPKRIVKTEIQGRNGTVKEYIGMDDWQITINGILTGPNGIYPVEDMSDLRDILKAPITLPVVSRYLQMMEIFNIVVQDYTLDQEPGGFSKQNFTINAISDLPVELQIQ
jgi:hypothetical protein